MKLNVQLRDEMVKRSRDAGVVCQLRDGVKSTVGPMNSEEMRWIRDMDVDGLSKGGRDTFISRNKKFLGSV